MMKTAIALCLATCAAAKLSQTQESQLERLKAGDVSKKEIELVLAHFNENQSWSDPYAAIRTTYCKGDPVPGCVPLENVGREGHTYRGTRWCGGAASRERQTATLFIFRS